MTNLDESLLRAAVIEAHHRDLAALPPEEELRRTFTLSPEHLCRMEALRRRVARGTVRTRLRRAVSTLLGAAAMLALLLGVVLTSSPELRAMAVDLLAPIFSGGRYGWNVAVPDGGEHSDADRSFAPAWVPEGYVLVYSGDNAPVRDLFYSDGAGGSFYFSYAPFGTNSSYAIRREDRTLQVITEQGREYYLLAAEEPGKNNYLFWTVNSTMFRLSSTLDAETLLKIAASVQDIDRCFS